jgi:cysteine desulfurase/selenocysteine lyase
MSTNINLSKYRSEFPFTEKTVFLNHASFGPIPLRSWAATEDYYKYMRLEKIGDLDEEAFNKLDDIRVMAAGMIGARPEEIAYATNTSYGLNVAAWGVDLKPGDKILLSDVEFPSNTYPWTNLRQKGIVVEFLPSRNRFFDMDNFVGAIDGKTKVLSLSFVQFLNGYKNDLKTIGEICAQKDIFFVVDGIQGVGCQEIDVKECKIDFLACGAAKWLLSSLGAGFFYLSSEAKRKVEPVFSGWLGVDWKLNFSDLLKFDLKPFPTARRFEIGTYPYSVVWTMHSSLQLLTEVGIKNIQLHTFALLDVLVDALQSKGYRITSSLDPQHRSSILSFSGKDIKQLFERLSQNQVKVSLREGSIRVSPHFHNDENDLGRLIDLLR